MPTPALLFAQALRSAARTVDAGLEPHSLRAYFIRRGDAAEPVRYEVDRRTRLYVDPR